MEKVYAFREWSPSMKRGGQKMVTQINTKIELNPELAKI